MRIYQNQTKSLFFLNYCILILQFFLSSTLLCTSIETGRLDRNRLYQKNYIKKSVLPRIMILDFELKHIKHHFLDQFKYEANEI